ncbi:MAG TPA: alpha/beta hydrolase, partial [Planctomycetia bacterium]|nr:alpha/beta hydrolase [Planctomycetia bacterium]
MPETIVVRGVETSVERRGSGPTVLFVHGFPLDGTTWSEQLEALAGEFTVVAPDLRGFGGTPATEGAMTMDDFADDMAAIVEAMSLPQPIVFCGLSMGGYVAWRFFERHRSLLRGLILCGTRAAPDSPEMARQRISAADKALHEGTGPTTESMFGRFFTPEAAASRPVAAAAAKAAVARASAAGIAAAQRGMAARPDSTPLLARIDVPTLLVCGTEDGISGPSEMEGMA